MATLLLVVGSTACRSTEPRAQEPVDASSEEVVVSRGSRLFALLDSDGDGSLAPFEALDVLLRLCDEQGGDSLSREQVSDALARLEARGRADARDFFEMGDEDGDGRVRIAELPEEFQAYLTRFDLDQDGHLDWEEFRQVDFDAPGNLAAMEAAAFHAELREAAGGEVRLDQLPPSLRDEVADLDTDGDGEVSLAEVEAMIRAELAGATFEVRGRFAFMNGVIGASTPGRVLELAVRHPEVDTLVMVDVLGSMDDVANLRAALYLRALALDTYVTAGGEVASGGTDFFLAGVERAAGEGARFGIHSWGGGPVAALDLPRDHEEHELYLDYYRAIGTPEAFYWRTLEAAPAEDIHWMSAEELREFEFFTGEVARPSRAD